ncbi:hypothetical protein SAMN05444359_13647 [Neolewinella agarilytica]|uniref:Uncharacterized protein n=2 Tax=Neolewinella agarilytica TaxID=478744 RepID=A0A1H9NGB2_9BACT|nr:hypothetical protein SAMN05444359_13647 [Neolewinella agarilytica]
MKYDILDLECLAEEFCYTGFPGLRLQNSLNMIQFLLLIVGGLILFIAGIGYTLRRLNLGKTAESTSGDGGLVGWVLLLVVMAGMLHFLISPDFRVTRLFDDLKAAIEQSRLDHPPDEVVPADIEDDPPKKEKKDDLASFGE